MIDAFTIGTWIPTFVAIGISIWGLIRAVQRKHAGWSVGIGLYSFLFLIMGLGLLALVLPAIYLFVHRKDKFKGE